MTTKTAQATERARAINLIKKLQAQTIDRGCTEGQAEKAMTKIGELMGTFDLTLSELSIEQENCIEHVIRTEKKRTTSQSAVVGLIELCNLSIFQRRSRIDNTIEYVAFGFEQDVNMFAYLFDVVEAAQETSIRDFKKSGLYKASTAAEKRVMSNSFVRGFQSRILSRCREMVYQREQNQRVRDDSEAATRAPESTEKTGRELVVIRSRKMEREFFNKYGFTPRGSRTFRASYRSDESASSAGASAGDKVNFNSPVGANRSQRRIGHG